MTNQWTDIMHSTLLLVLSNPVENHPGSSIWVTKALDNGAKAYVIDPRRTRMAAIVENRGGKHMRIRPGTDTAFINGIVRYVMSKIEDGTIPAANYVTKSFNPPTTGTGIFQRFDRGDGTGGMWPTGTVSYNAGKRMFWPLYTDAGIKLNAARTDYKRYGTSAPDVLVPDPDDANFAYWIDGFTGTNHQDPTQWTEANTTPNTGSRDFLNYARTTRFPIYTGGITHADTVFQYLKSRVSAYTPSVVQDICAKIKATDTPFWSLAEFQELLDDVINNAWAKAGAAWGNPAYKATSILYAMGTTQHTHGTQNVRAYSILQTLTGNMGRAGGGVNALRGIGNVQGASDFGLLQNLIPGYSGAPGSSYSTYISRLFGNSAGTGLQQRGFRNMTFAFFAGDPTTERSDAHVNGGTDINDPLNVYGYWPGTGSTKVGGSTNPGLQHRTTFVQMNPANPGYSASLPRIKAFICIGMNPVQSESNSGLFINGLKGLEMLVVSDMFLSETADAEVGPNTVVYFLPAAGFAEKCGTYTNSSRVIQWKWQVAPPKGNSKTDFEILNLLAYELIQRDALNVNSTTNPFGGSTPADVWNALYASQYGLPANPWTGWSNTDYQKDIARNNASGYVELTFRQLAKPLSAGGTQWIYTLGAWTATPTVPVVDLVGVPGAAFPTNNVSQRRNIVTNSVQGGPYIYPNWGHAWIDNRRIVYNRNVDDPGPGGAGYVPGDRNDGFVTPNKVTRLFVHMEGSGAPNPAPYATLFRTYTTLADADGRTPKHIEPKESPRPDLASTYVNNAPDSLVPYGNVAEYPLVLVTHRYVEHYQGGLMSRNVPYLNELAPEPILEISSADAATYRLVNGGLAYIKTARSVWAKANGVNDTFLHDGGWVGPFRVRIIGTTATKQRVIKGMISIPFHWGSGSRNPAKTLNRGPSGNLLTNDAQDPNTFMPESKTCLCAVRPG